MKESIVIGELPQTGPVPFDIEAVVKRWNHLWWISEHETHNTWKLIKYIRKDSPNTECKMAISEADARVIISKLQLTPERNPVLIRFFSWRRKSDRLMLEAWRAKKYGPHE